MCAAVGRFSVATAAAAAAAVGHLSSSLLADFNEGQTLQTQISKRSISLANLSLL